MVGTFQYFYISEASLDPASSISPLNTVTVSGYSRNQLFSMRKSLLCCKTAKPDINLAVEIWGMKDWSGTMIASTNPRFMITNLKLTSIQQYEMNGENSVHQHLKYIPSLNLKNIAGTDRTSTQIEEY